MEAADGTLVLVLVVLGAEVLEVLVGQKGLLVLQILEVAVEAAEWTQVLVVETAVLVS